VNRYVATAVKIGYIYRENKGKTYRVTPKALELSREAESLGSDWQTRGLQC